MKVEEVGAFAAKTHLSALLDKVERGQTIYITRRGRRVARLSTPESPANIRRGRVGATLDEIRASQRHLKPLTQAEIKAMINEGRDV